MSYASQIISGGASASNAVIDALAGHAPFATLAEKDGLGIQTRDAEDGEMLSAGIALSLDSGVLSESDRSTTPYLTIEVDGKTPEAVAEGMLEKIKAKSSSSSSAVTVGKVVTIVGLSGVGKGTTVSCLRSLLASEREDKDVSKVLCWSNGNIFRSLTMLTSLHMEQNGLSDVGAVIGGPGAAELKKTLMGMLKFERNPTTNLFDTHIVGLGVDYWVKDIETTVLKGPLVSGKIPTVAKSTQGEVVKFVRGAVDLLTREGGVDVIVEGRAETVDFIVSENRYELVMADGSVIGMRRAAQRVAGELVKEGLEATEADDAVIEKLKAVVDRL